MSLWRKAYVPTPEENLSRIVPECDKLRDYLVKWKKTDFVIAYSEDFVIHIFVEGDLGYNVEGTPFFSVATFNNCGPIDVLTFELLVGKIVVHDVRG